MTRAQARVTFAEIMILEEEGLIASMPIVGGRTDASDPTDHP